MFHINVDLILLTISIIIVVGLLILLWRKNTKESSIDPMESTVRNVAI